MSSNRDGEGDSDVFHLRQALFLDSDNPAAANNEVFGQAIRLSCCACVTPHNTHARLRTLTGSLTSLTGNSKQQNKCQNNRN